MSVEFNEVEFNEPDQSEATLKELERRRKLHDPETPKMVGMLARFGIEKEKSYKVLLWVCVVAIIIGSIVLYSSYRNPSQLSPEESRAMIESMKTPFPDEYDY